LIDRELHLVVPGPLEQRTGGYIYDAQMMSALRGRGWTVGVHTLTGRFPGPDEEAARSLERTLGGLPEYAAVIIDGLAMGAFPDLVARHAGRLRLLALVHHPLCDETGLEPERRRMLDRLERQALAHCRGIIVSSPFTVRRLQGWLPPGIRIVEVIPGTESAPRSRGPEPGHPPRLLCVGAVVPRKGQDVLVRALQPLLGREWECVVVGSLERDAAFATKVRRLVQENRLEDRVRLLGECAAPTLAELYDSSSAFVLPSWYEGYGMAFTEAMAHGLPVVASTGGAIPDTVPASAGIRVPPGVVSEWTLALARILDDPGFRYALSEGAWLHARSLPDWEIAGDRFQDALNVLLHA
jgi:glycosyltransferase involved in cell wall biosynthesis